jgi:hypothetical protein
MPRLLRQLSAAVNSSFEPAENYNIGCIITKVFPKSQKEHIIVTASVGDSLAFCFSPHTTEFELLIAPRQFKMKGSIETVPLRISERLEQYMLKVKQVQVPSDTILVSMTFKAYEALSRKCGKVMVSHSEKEYEYREFGFDKVKIVNLLKEVKEQNPKATTSDYRIYLADIIRSRPESKTEIPSKQDAILDLENQIEILTLEDGMTLHVEDLSTINNNHDSTLTIRR